MKRYRHLENVATLAYDREKCVGCGLCSTVCPHRIFAVADGKAVVLDREACMECGACARNCPVNCISMQSEEGENGRRRAAWFRINFARCIYCGLCEEACPTLALQLTPEFAFCKDDIADFVYEKEQLLVDHGGKHPDYDFYAHAGIAAGTPKGSHIDEDEPVDVKSIMP